MVDVGAANKSWLAASDNEERIYLASDFTSTPTIPKNHLGSMKIKANVDPHGSSSEWFVSSVWSFDSLKTATVGVSGTWVGFMNWFPEAVSVCVAVVTLIYMSIKVYKELT